MSCEQCGAVISKSLASSLVKQLKNLSDDKNSRLICVGCFFQNGRTFHPEEDEPPLSSRVLEELAHKPEKRDKSTAKSRVVAKIKEHSGKLPDDLRKRARYDISKRGRLGKPVSAKLNGEHVYECPLCGTPCPRTRVSGRSLDDVVIHILDSGEYEAWEATV